MDFNFLVVLVVAGLGCLWIVTSPLLRAIVLDTLRYPNRAAVFEVRDGVVTVTAQDLPPVRLSTDNVAYVETVWTTVFLREASDTTVGWPRLRAIASSEPPPVVRHLQPLSKAG